MDDPVYKIHALSQRPEPKSRFVPSKWERVAVRKLVRAIRRGDVRPPDYDVDPDDRTPKYYDLWAPNSQQRHAPFMQARFLCVVAIARSHAQQVKPPKPPLPGHAESYRPPEEYQFDAGELKEWNALDDEERTISHVPQRLDRLRNVPLFAQGLKERFERCLDLYLCPRTTKTRMNVDPQRLVPKLPKPQDLRPFPTMQSVLYEGHTKRVRTLSPHPSGQWLATGSDDKSARVWEVATGRCMHVLLFDDIVQGVAWCPNASLSLLAVASGETLYLVGGGVGSPAAIRASDALLALNPTATRVAAAASAPASWSSVRVPGAASEVGVAIKHASVLKQVTWHHKGDYVSTLAPLATSGRAVLIHQLSTQHTQAPFRRSKGRVEALAFHPTKPFFLLATQRSVRIYNLVQQKLFKKLQPPVKHISSIDVHPRGDNVLVSSFDTRLCWFDLDWSTRPYKTLRYHSEAIRRVQFHRHYPLFATASDDTTLHVFHGMTYDDLKSMPLIVPLKVLRGHVAATDGLGVLDLAWHPTQPWLFSAAADKTVRLWT
jgi:ribosome biogenesis protein ERB1